MLVPVSWPRQGIKTTDLDDVLEKTRLRHIEETQDVRSTESALRLTAASLPTLTSARRLSTWARWIFFLGLPLIASAHAPHLRPAATSADVCVAEIRDIDLWPARSLSQGQRLGR